MENQFFNLHTFLTIFPKVMENIGITLYLSLMTLLFGLLFGLLLTILQFSRYKLLKGIAKVYIDIMRGFPLVILILLVFFGSKALLSSLHINAKIFSDTALAIIALTLAISAYFSEMMRSAYLSVDKGQLEAINSLGIPPYIGFIRIILPQAAIIALPNLSNLLINIVKMTSLVSIIGIVEIFGRAQKISKNNYGINQLEVFVCVILIYWLLNVTIEIVMKQIAKKYRYLLN